MDNYASPLTADVGITGPRRWFFGVRRCSYALRVTGSGDPTLSFFRSERDLARAICALQRDYALTLANNGAGVFLLPPEVFSAL